MLASSQDFDSNRERDDEVTDALMTSPTARTINETDAQVVDMRTAGRSFALIAHQLDLANATEAQDRFLRSMRNSADDLREQMRREELDRLEGLAENLRCRANLSEDERAGLLRSVAQLRDLVRRC